jgi:hypothetical protein
VWNFGGEPSLSLTLHPNPTRRYLTVATDRGGVTLAAFDMAGRRIWSSNQTLVAGQQQTLDVSGWPTGSIAIVWRDAQGRSGAQRIVRVGE